MARGYTRAWGRTYPCSPTSPTWERPRESTWNLKKSRVSISVYPSVNLDFAWPYTLFSRGSTWKKSRVSFFRVSFEFLSCCEVSFLLFFFFFDFYFLRFRSWPVLSSSVRVLSKICDLFLPPTETKRIKVKQLCPHFLITGSSPGLRLFMYNLKYYFTTCTLCIFVITWFAHIMSRDTYTRMQASSSTCVPSVEP